MEDIRFISREVGGWSWALLRDAELEIYEANLKVSESIQFFDDSKKSKHIHGPVFASLPDCGPMAPPNLTYTLDSPCTPIPSHRRPRRGLRPRPRRGTCVRLWSTFASAGTVYWRRCWNATSPRSTESTPSHMRHSPKPQSRYAPTQKGLDPFQDHVCMCLSLTSPGYVCACVCCPAVSMQTEKELAVVRAARDQLERQSMAAMWQAATPEPVLVPPAGAADDGDVEPKGK